ncbi:Outer membrane protein TolC [Dyadobacter soli]|uniref:Outer membrane protein TolC n=1 Tax=Dyadobacter soli TaxID=659014 RepID=A0A1G6VT37_9BACT|nr:TolC family protein [Dyadobacter soli]SDD56721.1 Outer membrane protein TolC [Dyadobacter soli]
MAWTLSAPLRAQDIAATDTSRIFSVRDLEELVFVNHPVVKQADLLSDGARARVMQALGSFDPSLKASLDRKVFGDVNYYNRWTSELKVPLWVAGADLKIGHDRNVGRYTNPEMRTPLSGLTGVGISVPLGQGFLIDERRNTLKQARVMVGYAEAERVAEINKVWFQAVKDYWNWFVAYQQYVFVQRGLDLATTRYEATRNQTLLGDKPGIDSVEAYITVQERTIQLEKVRIDFRNKKLLVSNHLWDAGGNPVELPETAIPMHTDSSTAVPNDAHLDGLLTHAAGQHPKLQMLGYKGAQLTIERSYLREKLKPKLNVSGSLLTTRRDFSSYVPEYYDLAWGNYKVGVDFSFPLFLRAERGKLNELKVKQMDLHFDVQNENRLIRTNIVSSFNDLKAYQAQLAVQTRSIANQEILLRGELQKFDLGESTLFLINSRETKLIDMRIKRAELVAGYHKSLAELYYQAGTREREHNHME